MSDDKILFQERPERAEIQIVALSERRQKSYELLEGFRESLETLLQKPPLIDDMQYWLELEVSKTVKIEAMKVYLSFNPSSVAINLYAAIDAMSIPSEVSSVVTAWEAIKEHNPQEPMNYWSDAKQAFKPIKVNDEEKEKIRERNRLYSTPELATLYDTAKRLCDLINYSNTHFRGFKVRPGYIREILPFFDFHIEDVKQKSGEQFQDKFGSKTHVYRVKEENFLTKGEQASLFDEYNTSIRVIHTVLNHS